MNLVNFCCRWGRGAKVGSIRGEGVTKIQGVFVAILKFPTRMRGGRGFRQLLKVYVYVKYHRVRNKGGLTHLSIRATKTSLLELLGTPKTRLDMGSRYCIQTVFLSSWLTAFFRGQQAHRKPILLVKVESIRGGVANFV